MNDPSSDLSGIDRESAPTVGPPRWVKVFAIITAAVILLVVILLLTGGGGGHGPGRHSGGGTTPSSSSVGRVAPAAGHAP